MPSWRSKIGDRFAFSLVAALVTWFWSPALFQNKVLIHGDSALVGLPLMRMLRRGLHEHDSLIWFRHVLGGHPLFAEGQGGFASPLHVVIAYLFEPVRAIGVIHWASVLIGAGGVYCLARQLELSRWAATFAGLAVAVSSRWTFEQHNLPISTTLAWAPWLFVAVEHWLKQPSAARAALLALPAAFMVLAGYPQVAHGALVYAFCSLATLLAASSRRFVAQHARAFLWTGALALVLTAGLAAIQLLPLAELVQLSHRSQGIELSYGGFTPPHWIPRGLLFFYVGPDDSGSNSPSLGSAGVVLLASMLLVLRVGPRVLGHALAGLIVFNLGMSRASPLFSFIYDHHLLPGLHNFRIMHPYLGVALIGFAIVAAGVLDQLARERPALWGVFQKRKPLALFVVGALVCTVGGFCYRNYQPVYTWLALLTPVLIVLGYLALRVAHRLRWLPLLATCVLAGDALALRMNAFSFFDRDVLEPPPMIQSVLRDPELASYRVLSLVGADGMTFKPPRDPGLSGAYGRVLKSLGLFPGLEWRVPTIDGVLALPMARWKLVRAQLEAEAHGPGDKPRGLRLLDILAIRYVSSYYDKTSSRGLVKFANDGGVHLYRNMLARPQVSLYGKAKSVSGAEAALAGLRAAQQPTVFLEPSFAGEVPQIAPDVACPEPFLARAPLQIREAGDTRYRFKVEVMCDSWLFLSDANYPGWRAYLDGKRVPVYTAQVLGKAIQLPAGRHRVTFEYVPRSFYLGAAISGGAVLALLAIAVRELARRRKRLLLPVPDAAAAGESVV
ncbi:MAG TPA: YfhO family protein [Polyangiales bacterium]|nr:YfhO family protein [Polyangiales bacterium]